MKTRRDNRDATLALIFIREGEDGTNDIVLSLKYIEEKNQCPKIQTACLVVISWRFLPVTVWFLDCLPLPDLMKLILVSKSRPHSFCSNFPGGSCSRVYNSTVWTEFICCEWYNWHPIFSDCKACVTLPLCVNGGLDINRLLATFVDLSRPVFGVIVRCE